MSIERAPFTLSRDFILDLELACSSQGNIWLVGDRPTIVACLTRLHHYLATPVVRVQCPEAVPAAVHNARTLVLSDANRMDVATQRRVLELLERECRPRVISTSEDPVTASIADGTFLESLYYRLNTIYLKAGMPDTVVAETVAARRRFRFEM
jgi:hypothetical protein